MSDQPKKCEKCKENLEPSDMRSYMWCQKCQKWVKV